MNIIELAGPSIDMLRPQARPETSEILFKTRPYRSRRRPLGARCEPRRSARTRPCCCVGTGGVSIFVLQFAKPHGARVINTSSSDEKLERARSLGADLMVNYRATPQLDVEVLRLSEGRGTDFVLETGGTETFPLSVRSAAMAATTFVIGFLSGGSPTIAVLAIIEKKVYPGQ